MNLASPMVAAVNNRPNSELLPEATTHVSDAIFIHYFINSVST